MIAFPHSTLGLKLGALLRWKETDERTELGFAKGHEGLHLGIFENT